MVGTTQRFDNRFYRAAFGVPSVAPRIVYHYTSASGLIGIVSTKSLWATHARHSNDSREYSYALTLAAEEVASEKLKSRITPKLATELLAGLNAVEDARVHIVSFSEQPDMLSQWRAYAYPGGVAIGIRWADFRKTREYLIGKMLPVKCIYARTKQRTSIRTLIRTVSDAVRSRGSIFDRPFEARAEFAYGMSILASRMKDPGFAEEREWRLVWFSDGKFDKAIRLRGSHQGLMPYVPLDMTDIWPKCVRDLVLAPGSTPLSPSFRSGLRNAGLATARLRLSAIPLRSVSLGKTST